MTDNIIITDLQKLDNLKKIISKQGKSNFYVVADFDRTLTKAFSEDQKVSSGFGVIRKSGYLGEEFSNKANELFHKYYPMEVDSSLSMDIKIEKMEEWWEEYFKIVMKHKFSKSILNNILEDFRLELRPGAIEFFNYLSKNKIPIIIMSAGLGDLITAVLEKQGLLHDDVHIISNFYKFDNKGIVIGINRPIIHCLNKHQISIENLPAFYKIKERKNILLLGDSVHDLDMVAGMKYDNIIKIGFLNMDVDQKLDSYKKCFDIIITNDSDMEHVNALMLEIFGKS